MKTLIVYYSYHHKNTKLLVDALKNNDESIELLDLLKNKNPDINLSNYDRIGFASGIYFSSFGKPILEFIDKSLPENKDVFLIYTHGAPLKGTLLFNIKKLLKSKHTHILGIYHCRGYETYVFKKFGGMAKSHPNQKDIDKCLKFYNKIKNL